LIHPLSATRARGARKLRKSACGLAGSRQGALTRRYCDQLVFRLPVVLRHANSSPLFGQAV
jgi:hypothetical protein